MAKDTERTRLERSGNYWLVIDQKYNTVILATENSRIAEQWQQISRVCEHDRAYTIFEHWPRGGQELIKNTGR